MIQKRTYFDLDEFENESYKDNFSISEVYQAFGDTDDSNISDNRGFSVIKRNGQTLSEYEISRNKKIENFCLLLKESGNLQYAIKQSGLGKPTAKYYCLLLNEECERRGLPLIFKSKQFAKANAKLNEKQVSYIKYLSTKYSAPQVAAMYSVSTSIIFSIKRGLVWKDILPVIKSDTYVHVINQHLKKLIPVKQKAPFINSTPTHDQLLERIQNNRWGNSVFCPFCKHDKIYNLSNKIVINAKYKCAKCLCKFNLVTRTIYENSKIDLSKWFYIENSYLNENKSENQIALEVNCTQTTIHKILAKVKRNPFKSLILSDFEKPINF